jgi:hypothetical protein
LNNNKEGFCLQVCLDVSRETKHGELQIKKNEETITGAEAIEK